jgi:hypothetical protein
MHSLEPCVLDSRHWENGKRMGPDYALVMRIGLGMECSASGPFASLLGGAVYLSMLLHDLRNRFGSYRAVSYRVSYTTTVMLMIYMT